MCRILVAYGLFVLAQNSLFSSELLDSFLEKHCVRCHGPEQSEQDLDLTNLSRDFELAADAHLWAEVLERINSGEMPPSDEPQPSVDEIAGVVTALDQFLRNGKAARLAARTPITHYRLSREEYRNTVYDLFGVWYDPAKPGALNEDTLWKGFERIGSQLALSPSHVDRYYNAAGEVIDRAFSQTTTEPRIVRKTAADLRYRGGERETELLAKYGINRPLRFLNFPGRVQTAFKPSWFGKSGPEHSGLYKLRLQASGIRPPGGQPAHLSIGKKTSEETVEALIEFDVTANEDNPQVFEFEVFLELPVDLHLCVVATDQIDRRGGGAFRNAIASSEYLFTHSSETTLLNPNAPQMFDQQGNGLFSTVILDWIEWEGPIVTEDEKSKRLAIFPSKNATEAVVEEHLRKFAELAWRRPLEKDELKRLFSRYRRDIDAGELPETAYKTTLRSIMTSRHFIYLVEGEPVSRTHLTEWELASRLSYFLWSSTPDESLLGAANSGVMTGVQLKKHVDRMLCDDKIHHFIEDFSRQWLQLHRVGMFPPDRKLFPNYDAWLQASMQKEPVEYFRRMFTENLPIDQLIDSDWTMANARLCDFYGLPEPATGEFQPVALTPQDHRGGILTMGAILGLTSDGTRHRPVHRGVWLSETMFNQTPPSPPANVDPIDPVPPKGNKITVRQRIESHAKNASCAACHQRLDPLGLAFDQYDAIGQWREREYVPSGIGEDPPVDASGKMPDGREFDGAIEFKQLILEDRALVTRALVEKLCIYALRRVLTIDDKDHILEICQKLSDNDSGLKDIVREVALSELLRKR